ncbi:MAG: arsenate reductase [Myxococcota bacterium]|jgi:arsenate reductase
MAGVAFLCVANSAQSQIAEAIARHLDPDLEVYSAGSHPSHVRPQVYTILNFNGMDSRGLRSKGLLEIPLGDVDVAVVLCAEEECPLLPAHVKRLSWPLPDPTFYPDDELKDAFQATFDELMRRIPPLLKTL